MPDRAGDTEFKILKINIAPAQCQQLADSKAGCRVEQDQGAFPDGQLAEKKLQLREFENIGHLLPLRALADELDGVAIHPLVSHRVMEESAHEIPNLRLCSPCPLDAPQPLLNCDRLNLV